MTHKHHATQTTRLLVQKRGQRSLTTLLNFFGINPNPTEKKQFPRTSGKAILTRPCNGDTRLIAEVCAFERQLRYDMADDSKSTLIEVKVPASRYIAFVIDFFQLPNYPLWLLWHTSTSEWRPEEEWDTELEQWTEGTAVRKERMKAHARKLKEVRETGRYTFTS